MAERPAGEHRGGSIDTEQGLLVEQEQPATPNSRATMQPHALLTLSHNKCHLSKIAKSALIACQMYKLMSDSERPGLECLGNTACRNKMSICRPHEGVAHPSKCGPPRPKNCAPRRRSISSFLPIAQCLAPMKDADFVSALRLEYTVYSREKRPQACQHCSFGRRHSLRK